MNGQQLVAIGNELISSVQNIFPQDAEFESHYDKLRLSFICNVNWKLNNDATRPNKSSRTISIIIPHETIEDVNYEQWKPLVLDRFKAIIKCKYDKFNPDHNEPYNSLPPRDEWIVTSNDFNN